MAAHTPGPWRIEPNHNEELCIFAESEEFWIALLPHQCLGSIEAKQKINARLIAAAPELLAALKESPHDMACHPSEGRHSERCIRARAAIAKAEGAQ